MQATTDTMPMPLPPDEAVSQEKPEQSGRPHAAARDAAAFSWRRVAWATLATVLISAAGALAIFVIHRTTPPTPGSAAQRESKARPAAGNETPGTGASNETPHPIPRAGTVIAPPAAPAAATPPVMTQPPAAATDTAKSQGSISWSKGDGAAGDTAGKGSAGKAAEPPTIRISPEPSPATGVANAPSSTAKSGADGKAKAAAPTTQPAPQQAAGAPAASVAVAPGNAAAAGTAQKPVPARLQVAQQEQCASAELFSRLICDERVRLRFCRDRWNEHPDCIVQAANRVSP